MYFTLFNLQGTRLIRQELNYTTLGNRCQELFSDFSELFSPKSLSFVLSSSCPRQTRTCLVYHRFFSLSSTFFRSFGSFFLPPLRPAVLTAQTNSVIIPYALAFVKYFFQGRCVFPTAFPRLKHPSLKRLITIPEHSPLVNAFFAFFQTNFHASQIRPISMRFYAETAQDMLCPISFAGAFLALWR